MTVSPLALFGMQGRPFQIATTLAALKDGSTRVVAAASYQFPNEQWLDLDACKFDEAALRREALQIHDGYKQTCSAIEALAPLVPLPDPDKKQHADVMMEGARDACGHGPQPPLTVATGWTELTHAASELIALYSPVAVAGSPFESMQPKLATLQSAVTVLTANKPAFAECHHADELGDAAVRTAWESTTFRVGVSGREDRAQEVFGFNPDSKTPLADGRRTDGEVRVEASYAHARVQITAGLGIGDSRVTLSDKLVGYLSPSLSLAVVVGSLTGDPLYKNCRVNVVDGALPPRFVVGVDALVHWAPNPPSTQPAQFEKVAVTVYGDFRFTDKLTFRVGIPLTGDLATQKADNSAVPPVAEKRDLQWTLPVFVATVIKM